MCIIRKTVNLRRFNHTPNNHLLSLALVGQELEVFPFESPLKTISKTHQFTMTITHRMC